MEISQSISASRIRTTNGSIPVTISVGLAEMSDSDTSPEIFYQRVDGYLYQSKHSAKNAITTEGTTVLSG